MRTMLTPNWCHTQYMQCSYCIKEKYICICGINMHETCMHNNVVRVSACLFTRVWVWVHVCLLVYVCVRVRGCACTRHVCVCVYMKMQAYSKAHKYIYLRGCIHVWECLCKAALRVFTVQTHSESTSNKIMYILTRQAFEHIILTSHTDSFLKVYTCSEIIWIKVNDFQCYRLQCQTMHPHQSINHR